MNKELLIQFVYLLNKSSNHFFTICYQIEKDNFNQFLKEVEKSNIKLYKQGMKIIKKITYDEAKYELFQILYFYIVTFKKYRPEEVPLADYEPTLREIMRSCSEAQKYIMVKYFSMSSVTLYFVSNIGNFEESANYARLEMGFNYQNRVLYAPLFTSVILVYNFESAEILTRKLLGGSVYKHQLKYLENKMMKAIINIKDDESQNVTILDNYFDYDTNNIGKQNIKKMLK